MPTQSPNPARLYLNEHIPPRLAGQLRRYGFDAVSSQEAKMLSQDDEQQMAWAASEQRAIVTFNFADLRSTSRQAKTILASFSQPKRK